MPRIGYTSGIISAGTTTRVCQPTALCMVGTTTSTRTLGPIGLLCEIAKLELQVAVFCPVYTGMSHTLTPLSQAGIPDGPMFYSSNGRIGE